MLSVAAMVCGMVLTGSRAKATAITSGYFSASAPLINFDDLTGGNSITTGDIITNQYASKGIVFNNPDYPLRANATPIASEAVTASAPNVAFCQQHDGGNGRPLQLLFSSPVTAVGMQYFTSLSSTITLTVYNASNTAIESETLTGTQLNPNGDILEGFVGLSETTPIYSAQLSSAPIGGGGPFNFSIDNVRFTPVPEPASMGLVALLACGGLMRRRAK